MTYHHVRPQAPPCRQRRCPQDHLHAPLGSQNDRPAYPRSMCRTTLALKGTSWNEVMSTVHAVESGNPPARILAVRRRYNFKQPPREAGEQPPAATSSTNRPADADGPPAEQPDSEHERDYPEIDDKIRQRLLGWHRRIGHRNNRILVKVLRRLGDAAELLRAALNLECAICKQRASKTPFKKASVHLPALLGVSMSSDGFYWTDPCDQKVYSGTIAVDDGTGLTAAVLHESLEDGGNRMSSEVLDFLHQRWTPSYGRMKFLPHR